MSEQSKDKQELMDFILDHYENPRNTGTIDDADVEKYMKEKNFDFVLTGTIVTHYKWMKWFVNLPNS